MYITKLNNESAVSPVIGVIVKTLQLFVLLDFYDGTDGGYYGNFGGGHSCLRIWNGWTDDYNQNGWRDPFTECNGVWSSIHQWWSGFSMLNSISYTVDGGDEQFLFNSTPHAGQSGNTAETIIGKRLVVVGRFADGSTQVLVERKF